MAEEVEPDNASWAEIQVTCLFTVASAGIFLCIFEFARRNPAVSAVFDRRRSTKPNRTPPPLIRSRYFEWLFLSTDPAYCEYAEMAHAKEVIRERKRQQRLVELVDKFRLPYNIKKPGEDENNNNMAVIEEEEPKKKKKKRQKENESDYLSSPNATLSLSKSMSSLTLLQSVSSNMSSVATPQSKPERDSDNEANTTAPISIKSRLSSSSGLTTSIRDGKVSRDASKDGALKRARFHPEVPSPPRRSARGGLVGSRSTDTDSAGDSSSSSTSSSGEDEEAIEKKLTANQSGESIEVALSPSASTVNSSSSRKRKIGGNRRKSAILTPDVVHVNGRRLPANIAAWAIAGDLTEEQLDQYERELIEREKEEERLFKERQKELNKRKQRRFRRKSSTDGEDKENDSEDDDSNLGFTLPSRWGYLSTRQEESTGLAHSIRNVFDKFRRLGSDAEFDQFEDEPNNISGPKLAHANSPLGSDSNRSIVSSVPSSLRIHPPRSSLSNRRASPRAIDSAGTTSANPPYTNRHLKSADVANKRPLSIADSELLRCVGLDTFVMIRFLRFGFDVTFYPFLCACLILFPTYYTNPYEGAIATENSEEIVTGGYFRITMNRLEPGSPRLWISCLFGMIYFSFVLRRIWIEWETFIALRFDFLANGDAEMDPDPSHDEWMRLNQSSSSSKRRRKSLISAKKDDQLHLEQYRNSCIVEFIPDSHRRDKELFEFYNAIFPGQVVRAEILLNANKLTKLIAERKKYIQLYEKTYAKHFHAKQVYRKKTESLSEDDVGVFSYLCCRCFGHSPNVPPEPRVKIRRQYSTGGFWNRCCTHWQRKKMVKALPYYLSEIKRLNREVECEHRRIMEERQKSEDKYLSQSVLAANLAQTMKFMTGVGGDLTCDTGFVEFNNLTAKQSALQCNITGTNQYMVTKSAPDPRDIVWENATVERGTINIKKFQMDSLLFAGTLTWSVVVIGITSISNLDRLTFLPDWLVPATDSFWYGLIQGYLPVIVLELLMLFILFLLRFIGEKVIRFKVKSEVDKFVFRWHFGYRVANLVIIIVSRSLIETLDALRTNPQDFIFQLAGGISASSQFFLNNMIVAAGSENLWELAQITNMIFHFVMHKITTVEATSKRALEKLEEAERFDWGEVVPTFIFSFLVAAVYVTIVPLVIGACALFFYISTKVYTHQVLFVYAQTYEGGGKLMYLLNRTVFVIIYISVVIFATVLGLKEAKVAAPFFLFIMFMTTLIVDKKINNTFVEPSVSLALTNSRLIDEENKRIEERALRYQEYKAAKLERKRQLAKAARTAAKESKRKGGGKQQGRVTPDTNATSGSIQISSRASSDVASTSSSRAPSIESSPVRKRKQGGSNSTTEDSEHKKSIQFKVTKEDTVEQLEERATRHAKKPLSQYGTPIKKSRKDTFNFDDDSDEEDERIDFYLYRQPQLNKTLWETKPRPYR